MLVGLSEVRELHLLTQFIYLFVVDDYKLLIGWRVNIELESLTYKHVFHSHGHLDGMFRELKVKIVSKQRIELQPNKSSFGYNCTMLFLDREEVLVGIVMGKHYSLAT